MVSLRNDFPQYEVIAALQVSITLLNWLSSPHGSYSSY